MRQSHLLPVGAASARPEMQPMSARDAALELQEHIRQLLAARISETPVRTGPTRRRLGEMVDRLHDALEPVERIHAIGRLDALQEAVEKLLRVPFRGVDVPPEPRYDAPLEEAMRAVEEALANVWPVRMAAQTGGSSTHQAALDDLRPCWDSAKRQLTIGADVVRSFRRYAPTQFAILDAFQAQNWPTSIAKPKSCLNAKDTVEALNDGLVASRLRFGRRENDTMISWNLTA